MILYELMSPNELKYGGSLTEEQAARCQRQTSLDSAQWAPYPARQTHVENLCGKFVVRVGESTATERGDGVAAEGSGGTSSASGVGESGRGCAEEGGGVPVPEFESSAGDMELANQLESYLDSNLESNLETNLESNLEPSSASNLESNLEASLEASLEPALESSLEGGCYMESNDSAPLYMSCLSNQRVVTDDRLSSVCFKADSPFGRQYEMFHLDGHVTVRCTPGLPRSMIFKGARGVKSIDRLKRDLFLDEEALPLVHMGVVSACMGVRLQTSQCCYLENRVLEGCGALRGGWIGVEARLPDQCNIVRLSVRDWRGLLPPDVVPTANDLVITGKGSAVHRLSWAGLPWDARVERELLGACARVVDAIVSVF